MAKDVIKHQQVDNPLQLIERGLDIFLKVRREIRATDSHKRANRAESRSIRREERAEEKHEMAKKTYFGR